MIATLSRARDAIVLLARRRARPAREGAHSIMATMDHADTMSAARCSNAFAARLWAEMGDGNVVTSPASVWVALMMTAGGARGETQEEMEDVLEIAGEAEAMREAAGAMLRAWRPDGGAVRVANRLFGARGYRFEESFLDMTRTTFDAPLDPLDFDNAPEASRQHINAWVARRTEERIAELLPAGSIDGGTTLVLANAIHFLGTWAAAFPRDATRDAPFHLASGITVRAPTMHVTAELGVADAGDVRVVELPYAGSDLAMDIVLPGDVRGLAGAEAQLSSGALPRWLAALRPARVALALPRFAVDPSATMRLGQALGAMGMAAAFDRSRADFGGIARPTLSGEGLCLGDVFHQAFLRVDEEGTEAAAASAVVMVPMGLPRPPESFLADRPFLFLVRDRHSGLVLFLGRLADPLAAG
ncbi:MAG: serpin family protein [Acidobacteriota bacterium]